MTDETPPEQETPAPEQQDQADKPLGPGGEKALASEREARKAAEKANADLAARLKEFEDRDKSELERLTERAATAEREAADARRESLRYSIAAETGIPANLLNGDDEEAMRGHAERLKAFVETQRPSTPKPDPSQGARGPVDIDDQIRDAESRGDIGAAIALKNQKLLASTVK